MRIYRLMSDGTKWEPALNDGLFVLADPSATNEKHHAKNEVLVRTEDEAIRLLRQGFSIRVKSKAAPVLVRKNLVVDGVALA